MKHWSFKKSVASLSLITLLTASLLPANVFAASGKTAAETVRDMGIGWNLGNTLEACNTNEKLQPSAASYPATVQGFETYWGNIVTTQKVIDGVKAAGFNSVRIPVAWSNLIASDYTINKDLLKRVKEVADYCSNDGMYVIVNIHWDGGWFKNFSTNYDGAMDKYSSIWTQISSYFKDYPDNLIFESLNEEGCWDDIWNRWSGTTGDSKTRAFNTLNKINQKFVDIVRASGGTNASRCLLIAGYGTDIDLTCDDLFKMPKDTISSKLMISVHYYTPSTFTILEQDADWGKCARTWGTTQEISVVKTDFNKMKTKFADKGYPVIVGEYGSTKVNKDAASVRLYISTVCKTAYDLGFCPMLWDPGTHFSRSDTKFTDSELAAMFLNYKKSEPTVKIGDVNSDGKIDVVDASMYKSVIVKKKPESILNAKAADLNGDNALNSIDYLLLKKLIQSQI